MGIDTDNKFKTSQILISEKDSDLRDIPCQNDNLKVPKCEIFDPFFLHQ